LIGGPNNQPLAENVFMYLTRIGALLASLALAFANPLNAEAKSRALLIGVSSYRSPSIPKLEAPKNDVALMWDLLRERGFSAEDITVLSDEIDPDHVQPIPHGEPTAHNILHQLDALTERAEKDDLVLVYYSGHGTVIRQRPPRAGETIEYSGNNHVLLAIDAGKADDLKAEIPGGILDKDLKRKFDAIRAKAFLWLVLDSCHAEGLTRYFGTVHFVPPHLLGLNDALPTSKSAENRWISGGIGGRQVAFLAAPENSPAFEKPIFDLNNKRYSLFTQSLVRLLRTENFGSYRALGEALLARQAALPGNVPTPVIEGDLDQSIFAGTTAGPSMWDAHYEATSEKVAIDAGSLQGMAPGTIISLEGTQGLVGYAKVEAAAIVSSFANPVPNRGKTAPSSDLLKGRLTAKVITSTIDLFLTVALPPTKDIDGGHASNIGLEAIQFLRQDKSSPLPIRWVGAEDNADIYLRIMGDVIYVVPATGELVLDGRQRTPGIQISGVPSLIADGPDGLRDNAWKVLRRLNLRRAANEVRSNDLAKAVEVRLRLVRDANEFSSVVNNEQQTCATWNKSAYKMASSSLEAGGRSGIRLTHCDRVTVEITNNWPKAVDVTLLYLDSQGGISHLSEGDQPRVQPATPQHPFVAQFAPVEIVTWCDMSWDECHGLSGYQPVGTEQLLAIITEAAGTKHTFSYLAQGRLSQAVAKRRTLERAGVPLEELLIDAGLLPSKERGPVDKETPGTIKIFTWDVIPPAEASR
jgi:Caspase domain